MSSGSIARSIASPGTMARVPLLFLIDTSRGPARRSCRMLPPRSARLSATEEEEGQATEPRFIRPLAS
jgi:hypothetical protein